MLFFARFRRRSRNQSRPARIANPATPPTTPPAMAPVFDDDELSDALAGVVASAVLVAVVVGVVVLDIVDDGKAVEVEPVDGGLESQFKYDSVIKGQAAKALHTMIPNFQETQTTVQGGCIISATDK